MCPSAGRTCCHHSINASTQKSLVSRPPKINVSAPVANTKMPNGVHFRFAGGSWSHALGVWSSASVRLFSPPGVIALAHLRLGVDGRLQRRRIVLDLLTHRLHVGEDRIRLLGLFQRLGLLNPLEAITHPIQDVAQGPLAGQVRLSVALLGLQLLERLRSRQVAVATFRLEFGVGVGVRLDDSANVLCPLGFFLFPAGSAAGRKVLLTTDALLQLVQAFLDGVASPAEAAFGLAGTAVAQPQSDFGHEQPAFMPAQTMDARMKQNVVTLDEGFHDDSSGWRGGTTSAHLVRAFPEIVRKPAHG